MSHPRRWAGVAATVVLAQSAILGAQNVSLRGTVVVAPGNVIADGIVVIKNGVIVQVAPVTGRTTAIDVEGVIFPGLINLHDHITWNVFPRWTPSRLFQNRYEWQDTWEYNAVLRGPQHALDSAGYSCAMNRYGEVKALVNGATSTVGGLGEPCAKGLVRNLEYFADLTPSAQPGAEPFRNEVFPFELGSPCEEQAIRNLKGPVEACAGTPSPTLQAVVAHVAEGVDASAKREFRMLESRGLLKKGLSIIHGVPLDRVQFESMKVRDVGLIWSPHSNLALYGKTADVVTAKAVGVQIALAPDWSPSGGTGMLDEVSYVQRLREGVLRNAFTDEEIVAMVTTVPAKLAALNTKLGRLDAGLMGDLIVLRWRSREDKSPAAAYSALLLQRPTDLKLVVIGGKPVFGDTALMKALAPAASFEVVNICGEMRGLNALDGLYATVPWHLTVDSLRAGLAAYRLPLSPLIECR
jgi:5-methylthioadenosine/S-adenosylhomocysteine deaminase